MVTERDEKVLMLIVNFQVLTTSHINQLVYNNRRVCQRRLEALVDQNILYRCKNLYSKEYVYSAKPINTKQLKHKLARVEFYMSLLKISNVRQFLVEPDLEKLRPDALVICNSQTNPGVFFALEIETSNNTINMTKYEKFLSTHYDKYFKAHKEKFKVVCVTNKVIPKTSFQVIKIHPDLSNLSDILR